MSKFLRSCRFAFLLGCFLSFAIVSESKAQLEDVRVGIGGQIGDPSGVTVKFYEEPNLSYDFLLALDLNRDFVFMNIHRTWEEPLQDGLRYFYGPGLVIGTKGGSQQDNRGNEMIAGLSFTVGVNYFIERFEIFLNLTPRLEVLPATTGHIGGGGGLRYYF